MSGNDCDPDFMTVPNGYRLQPLAEQEACNLVVSQHSELCVLVRRLASALRKRDPDNATAASAMRYLQEIGEQGSPFRDIKIGAKA